MMNASWHYPTRKTPELSRWRQETTNQYAAAAAVVVAAVAAGWPVWRALGARRAWAPWRRHWHWGRWLLARLSRALTWLFFHSTSVLQLALWLAVLVPLLVAHTDGDLLAVAKRLGKIPAVCLPTVLFLLLRPSPLPRVLYLLLLPVHKWVLRIVVAQLVVHVALYLGYFAATLAWPKALKAANLWGWAALAGFLALVATLLLAVRRRYYWVFYANHYVWLWVVVVSLQFHARPVRVTPLTAANVCILLGQVAFRWHLSRGTRYLSDVQVIDVSENMSLVEFPNELLAQPATSPGAHVRVAKRALSWIGRAAREVVPLYHPYTLVSLPLDRFQKLIVKRGRFRLENDRHYVVCGSYDPHLLFLEAPRAKFSIARIHLKVKRLLIVVGGLAVSFAIPLVRVMLYHGLPVKVVWVVRDFRDIVVLNYFSDHIQGDDFEIFVTGNYTDQELQGEGQDREEEREEVEIAIDEVCDDECCSFDAGEPNEPADAADESAAAPANSFAAAAQLETTPLLRSRSRSLCSSNAFEIPPDSATFHSNLYKRTLAKLNLTNRIYKGRPTLNHRYRQWCYNESNFTQCLGPIAVGDNTFICCKNVPVDKHGNDLPGSLASSVHSDPNCWVIAAGPRNLVRNAGLWARENGLEFHQESFTV